MAGDTILAPSTAPGRAGIAVLRVSGPCAGQAVRALSGSGPPAPKHAVLKTFRDAQGTVIDRGLLLWFEGPHSFTGEDIAEFHVHGGRAIVEAMLNALSSVEGLRAAEPGEFTRRAVENGKLDLTQAEALADLIDSQTEAQRKQALAQFGGALSELYEGWRTRIIRAVGLTEAVLDFPDEEVPDDVPNTVQHIVAGLIAEIRAHLDDHRRGEILRDGVNLTVFGKPNSGKSSLLNALAQRDVAIVSEVAGTTRDVIEVRLDLGGYPVIVSDTAGLRESSDPIEQEGVRRAIAKAKAADIALLLVDASDPAPTAGLPPDVGDVLDLVVWNKTDIGEPRLGGIPISAKTGTGLPELLSKISELAGKLLKGQRNEAPLTRIRHRTHLEEALGALERSQGVPERELSGEDLRLALRSLGRITGRVDVEDVLDVVFREFCIGK
ncbi:MAG TPA: tRNA uridine-5-carboxymethylaminomethyl(34) synthesis GTPase MnmE [Nitrospira sp.]|nr:tRNA uridine-5-carboxymethylaminomethyl(34) synthesis GTPase MnmE [Nitrospira sp.]